MTWSTILQAIADLSTLGFVGGLYVLYRERVSVLKDTIAFLKEPLKVKDEEIARRERRKRKR